MTYKNSGKLTLKTPDSKGWIPQERLIGQRLEHTGNHKVYVVEAHTWLGETDEWGFIAREEGNGEAVPITRPCGHLNGNRSNGAKRYIWL